MRPGINIVAIEILRRPDLQDVFQYKLANVNDSRFRWPPCLLYDWRRLTAAEGLTPNACRPRDFQVWNQNLLASDFVVDWATAPRPARSMEIVGVRNGEFSGKVMVGSAKPIRGLKVAAGDLKGPSGVIRRCR